MMIEEKKIIRLYQTLTNNQAEYFALLMAFEYIAENGINEAEVFTDSQLIEGHLNKGWKINKNNDIVQEAKDIYESFFLNGKKIVLKWIRRDENLAGKFIENIM